MPEVPPGLVSTTGIIEVVLPPLVWLGLLVGVVGVVVVFVVVILIEVGDVVVLDGVVPVPPVVVVVVPPVVVLVVPPVVVVVVVPLTVIVVCPAVGVSLPPINV